MKIISNYINFTIGQYIIEPTRKLDKWLYKYIDEIELEECSKYIFCAPSNLIYKIPIITNAQQTKDIIDSRDWNKMSYSQSWKAYKILKKNIDKIIWNSLCTNQSIWAGKLIANNFDKIDWEMLIMNGSKWAVELLENNEDMIDLMGLSLNSSEWAYELFRYNLDCIVWEIFSNNWGQWAYKLLKKNPDKIDWRMFSINPNMFVPDVNKTKKYYKLFDEFIYKKQL